MVKKVTKPAAVIAEQAPVEAKKKVVKEAVIAKVVEADSDIDMNEEEQQSGAAVDDGDESITIKQKKENALKLAKAVKKMNAKLKKSLEKKQIVKAVQALQAF